MENGDELNLLVVVVDSGPVVVDSGLVLVEHGVQQEPSSVELVEGIEWLVQRLVGPDYKNWFN